MRWKIGQFEFNQSTNVLSLNKEEWLLEPKTAALLSYFLKNSHKDISRDQLLEHVWDGQIVSENAINRVIVRLRKALKDEGKVKAYIVTVPKTGYRFVANVSELQEPTRGTTRKSTPAIKTVGLIALGLSALFVWWVTGTERLPTIQNNPNVSPVTRLSGEQLGGTSANTSSQFVYSHRRDDSTVLYWAQSPETSATAISPLQGTSKNAHWAPDDSALIYQYTNNDICEFRLIPFDNGQPGATTTIYECPMGSSASFAVTADNRYVFFTERLNEFTPYEVYSLDLTQGSKRRISQPMVTGHGNYHIDRDPRSGKLLLLSAETPGKTSAFSLDVTTNDFQKLMEFDYRVDYAVWGHKTDTLVHMGEHPSYQLVETNYTDRTSLTLVTDSRRITEPKRANNGKDYLFRSFLVNRDIAVNGEVQQELNSSVRDYLPVYSNDGRKLAFISKRAGYSQVWVKDYATDQLFPIEVKDRGRIYRGLAWSPDDTKLAANTDGGVILIDVIKRLSNETLRFALPTYALAWPDKNSLTYSHFIDGRWNHYAYDTRTNVTSPKGKNWAFSLSNETKTLYLDQKLILHEATGEVVDTSNCSHPILRSTLTFRLKGDKLYCLAHTADKKTSLLHFNGKSFEHFLYLPDTTSSGYTVAKDSVAVSVVSSSSSDIMRTNFAN